MSCCHRNLIINDQVNNRELRCHDLRFHHEVDHIIFYKGDRPLDSLKTCYEKLEGTRLKVFHL